MRRAGYGSLVMVAVIGFAMTLVNFGVIFSGTGLGGDLDAYLGYTRTWLATGHWYAPVQLAGPYLVEQVTGNVYPPTLLYLTVPFALGVPVLLWYAIPLGIGIAALRSLGLSRRRWVLLGLFLLCYPRWWTILLAGNPALWAFAFLLAGLAWGWPSVFVALKLTFAPLALVGLRRRSWFVALGCAVLLAVPFGALWGQYLTVLGDTRSSFGLGYVLGEWPIALALVAVSLGGSRGGSETGTSSPRPSVPASGS